MPSVVVLCQLILRSLANLKENEFIIHKLPKKKVTVTDLLMLLMVWARYGLKLNLLSTHSPNMHTHR